MSLITNDDFNHHIAIKLSRVMNTMNPNDLLAQTVIEFAKTNTTAGFIKGIFCAVLISWLLSI